MTGLDKLSGGEKAMLAVLIAFVVAIAAFAGYSTGSINGSNDRAKQCVIALQQRQDYLIGLAKDRCTPSCDMQKILDDIAAEEAAKHPEE